MLSLAGFAIATAIGFSGLPVAAQISEGEVTPHWQTALASAAAAETIEAKAILARDWDQAVGHWLEALKELQQVPTDSPQRPQSQRRLRQYIFNLQQAQKQAEAASIQGQFPTFNSQILDEQLALYQSYVASFGPPQVLIVGSSRSLMGIDAQALQRRLQEQGLDHLRVYNFSINGATAQVVSLLLRQILPQPPALVIWGSGSRAFNSGRVDRTFAQILTSPGYRALQAGYSPLAGEAEVPEQPKGFGPPAQLVVSAIDAQGFMPVADVFDSELYYQTAPRVAGLYDGAYQGFELGGVQQNSLDAIAGFLRRQGVALALVNLPLSSDYLDETRWPHEQQFQQYLQQQADRLGFTAIDLLEKWRNAESYFADPSHINQYGAAVLARQLADSPEIPWLQLAEP